MKALVIRQPWAELIVSGRKSIEVRTWRTKMQDEFLIVAGKTADPLGMRLHGVRALPGCELEEDPPVVCDAHIELDMRPGAICAAFPIGVAVGIARVYKVEPFNIDSHGEKALMVAPVKMAQLYAWHLGQVRRLSPFAVRGMPGFFNVKLAELECVRSFGDHDGNP